MRSTEFLEIFRPTARIFLLHAHNVLTVRRFSAISPRMKVTALSPKAPRSAAFPPYTEMLIFFVILRKLYFLRHHAHKKERHCVHFLQAENR
jgi:hypothetical protein